MTKRITMVSAAATSASIAAGFLSMRHGLVIGIGAGVLIGALVALVVGMVMPKGQAEG